MENYKLWQIIHFVLPKFDNQQHNIWEKSNA